MRILIHLPNAIAVFQPTEAQLRVLARACPDHAIVPVADDREFLARLPEAEAAVVWRFRPEWYALATRLRQLFTPSAGHEPLPPDPAGRVVRHFGAFHGAIMAESLLGMVLFMNRRFGRAVAAQRERVWDRAAYVGTRGLAGQVALIVGYGAIGRHCARRLSALGVIVHGLRRDVTRGGVGADRLFGPGELHAALAGADHVVCVLPADTGTDCLIDAAALARMKPDACLYNIGRGNAIDAPALVAALAAGRIAGAFLDVLPEEPLPASSPLWNAPNLYLTPHASAISAEYLDLYFEELAPELARLAGAP